MPERGIARYSDEGSPGSRRRATDYRAQFATIGGSSACRRRSRRTCWPGGGRRSCAAAGGKPRSRQDRTSRSLRYRPAGSSVSTGILLAREGGLPGRYAIVLLAGTSPGGAIDTRPNAGAGAIYCPDTRVPLPPAHLSEAANSPGSGARRTSDLHGSTGRRGDIMRHPPGVGSPSDRAARLCASRADRGRHRAR